MWLKCLINIVPMNELAYDMVVISGFIKKKVIILCDFCFYIFYIHGKCQIFLDGKNKKNIRIVISAQILLYSNGQLCIMETVRKRRNGIEIAEKLKIWVGWQL